MTTNQEGPGSGRHWNVLLPLKLVISGVAVALLVAHMVLPDVKLDAISLGFLVVAILPWLSGLFESMEFPGGWKISFRDLQRAADDLPDPPDGITDESTEASFMQVRDLDPALALVGLRIEIERRLQIIAERIDLRPAPKSAGVLLRRLVEKGALSGALEAALREVIFAGNAAAHGAPVPSGLEDWAFQEGPRLLSWLDAEIGKHDEVN
jgi:hypothetical protein